MAAGFVQGDRFHLGTQPIYYGVALAVAMLMGVLLWLNRFFQSRFAGLGMLLAWVVTTWQLATTTFGGDLALSPSTNANAYLVGGSLCIGIAAAAPIMRLDFQGRHQVMNGSDAFEEVND